jgi:sugar phosphate isomerase/epimerase
MNRSRRDFLRLGVGAAALGAAAIRPAGLLADGPKKKIPIGLQLYSVRDACAKDLPGTLDAVAKMGYMAVEFAGYYERKAPELRKMLDQRGLKCCGTHTALSTLTGDALKETAEFSKILGNQFLIVPSLPPANMASIAALIDTAKLLTDLADRAKDLGMRVGYHAHFQDFTPLADRIPYEVIFSNAGPSVVMQLDTGNCLDGGGNPVAVLKKFPGRAATIHLKEHGGPKGAPIGEGDVPWKQIFTLCETTGGTKWYIVEQETYKDSPLESVELCLKNLRKMGK